VVELTASPFLPVRPVEPDAFAVVRRRAIFECCKWDPQVEDVATLAPFPLVMRRQAWDEIAALAVALAAEAAGAEEELARRPDLHRVLGLPRAVRRALAGTAEPSRGAARVVRFDFHWTTDGWRISEANTDVPGGFNEASGFTRLMAAEYGGSDPAGDPAGALTDAMAAAAPAGSTIALVHATAYTDDRQVMTFLGRELAARGRETVLAAPDHLRWRDGRASVESAWFRGEVGAMVRFFPGEWLPNLPRSCGWQHFFRGGRTPVSNPASALLTQSKRFPLVWDRLERDLPTWRRLLPETRDPRDVSWQEQGGDGWVFKPVLGRVGDGIGLAGVTPGRELEKILRSVRWFPSSWAAQRRFEAIPHQVREQAVYPCVGVYTVDGRVAGAYGRVARLPLVDHLAQDIAVLVEAKESHERAAAL
jgi:glutathionylspermidine synthase